MKERVKRRVPINKRFPGRCAFRFQIWTPDATVMLEGPVSKEGSEAMFAAVLRESETVQKQRKGAARWVR